MKNRIIRKLLSIFSIRFPEVLYIGPLAVSASEDFDVYVLSVKDLQILIDREVVHYPEDDINRIEEGISICVAAFFQGEFAGLCWYAVKDFRHTPGYTAMVRPGYMCGYGLRIEPKFQGRGVHAVLLAKALAWKEEAGKQGIFLAINFDNLASRKSAEKLGFRRVGFSFHCRWLKCLRAVRHYYTLKCDRS